MSVLDFRLKMEELNNKKFKQGMDKFITKLSEFHTEYIKYKIYLYFNTYVLTEDNLEFFSTVEDENELVNFMIHDCLIHLKDKLFDANNSIDVQNIVRNTDMYLNDFIENLLDNLKQLYESRL